MLNSSLEALAYRLTGSYAEAEDVVQEARLRLLKQPDPPDNEQAWLFRVVINLSLDRLRAEKRHRRAYTGPWLPEPVMTGELTESADVTDSDRDGPEFATQLAEQLSMGFMLMLERLTPGERAVFVLREGFDLSFDEIGRLLEVTASACRQRYRRARNRLARPDSAARSHTQLRPQAGALLDAFLEAVAEGSMERLAALLAQDCVAYTDGGGVVSAAIIPITGVQRIAQVTLHLARRLEALGSMELRTVVLNGAPGVLVLVNGELYSTLQIEGVRGQVHRIYIVRNPEKLGPLRRMLDA